MKKRNLQTSQVEDYSNNQGFMNLKLETERIDITIRTHPELLDFMPIFRHTS